MKRDDRLTAWNMAGDGMTHAVRRNTSRSGTTECLDKLGHYEDLGYTPDELRDIVQKYIQFTHFFSEIEQTVKFTKNEMNL